MAYRFKFSSTSGEQLNSPYKENIDGLLENTEITFVGWRADSPIIPIDGYAIDNQVNVVEIFQPNASLLRKSCLPNVNVVCNDIRNVYKNFRGCLIW